MNIEDISITETIKNYPYEIGYIHFADSNRLAPGLGHIDFKTVLLALKEIKYSRWIGIEVLPKPDPYNAAKQSIEYLKRINQEN